MLGGAAERSGPQPGPTLRGWGARTARCQSTAQNSHHCAGSVARGRGLERPYGRSRGNQANKPALLPLDSAFPGSKYARCQSGPLSWSRRVKNRRDSRWWQATKGKGLQDTCTVWTNSVRSPGVRTRRLPVFVRMACAPVHASASGSQLTFPGTCSLPVVREAQRNDPLNTLALLLPTPARSVRPCDRFS